MDLSNLSITELEILISNANKEIKRKKIERLTKNKDVVKNNLKVGDIVSIDGKRFAGEIWEVLKLNPKKVLCKRENGEEWRIPYSHIILE